MIAAAEFVEGDPSVAQLVDAESARTGDVRMGGKADPEVGGDFVMPLESPGDEVNVGLRIGDEAVDGTRAPAEKFVAPCMRAFEYADRSQPADVVRLVMGGHATGEMVQGLIRLSCRGSM
jgi:hypothetical protein